MHDRRSRRALCDARYDALCDALDESETSPPRPAGPARSAASGACAAELHEPARAADRPGVESDLRFAPFLLTLFALLSLSCMGGGKWEGAAAPRLTIERVSAVSAAPESYRVLRSAGLPELPLRRKIRMCCAFGADLRVELVGVPLPFVHVGQVLSAEDLGPHRYDGATGAIDDERAGAFPFGEHNGLVYTCHGGFIDTAHARETVDWTAFLVTRIDRLLESGGVIELTDEGAARRIVLEPAPEEWLERHGRHRVVLELAQWLSYQISLWHEIAQWYGWSIVGLFPEGVSAFSPEDLYSNAVGVKLLDGLDLEIELASEKIYDRRMDRRIRQALRELGAVPASLGDEALRSLDQLWWDSGRRLPDKGLVRRRYVRSDLALDPWLLPASAAEARLRSRMEKHCGKSPEPRTIRISSALGNVPFSRLVRLEVRPDAELSRAADLAALGEVVSQAEFPHLVERVREQNRIEFGPRADLPD